MSENCRAALVSGGNRGIGRDVFRQLGERGITVILSSRGLKRGEAPPPTSGRKRLRIVAKQLDVREKSSIERVVHDVEKEFSRLDILVNNAAITDRWRGTAEDADFDAVKNVLETNLFGAWRLAKSVIPIMRRNGYGRIVNLS